MREPAPTLSGYHTFRPSPVNMIPLSTSKKRNCDVFSRHKPSMMSLASIKTQQIIMPIFIKSSRTILMPTNCLWRILSFRRTTGVPSWHNQIPTEDGFWVTLVLILYGTCTIISMACSQLAITWKMTTVSVWLCRTLRLQIRFTFFFYGTQSKAEFVIHSDFFFTLTIIHMTEGK